MFAPFLASGLSCPLCEARPCSWLSPLEVRLEQAQNTRARLAQWFGQLVRSENPATGSPSCSSKDRISQLPLV